MSRPATAANRLLSGEREPCRAATTANVTLYGLQTIDGVALEAGDRLLVKDQTNATENGIYAVSAGRWFRASDARSTRAIDEGVTVAVQDGSAAGNAYRFATNSPKIGTDPILIEVYLTPGFATTALAAAASMRESAIPDVASGAASLIPANINSVRAAGGAVAGDGGLAQYALLGAVPAHAGYFTDTGGRIFGLTNRRVTPAMFKRAGNTWAQAFNAAAVYLAANGGGVIDLDGRSYTFTAPLVVNGSDVVVDANGARVLFDHNAGTCLTFGDGATQRHRNALLGGYWEQSTSCLQFMLEVRGIRRFWTDGVVTANLYRYMQWGRSADAIGSYIWTQSNEVIDLRTAYLNGGSYINGHSNGIVIDNSFGAFYQSNIQLEAANSFDNENFATTAGIYFPPTFKPARFDHWMASNVFIKGFSRNIFLDNARVVNLQWGSVRLDDSRIAAMHVNASVAGKGGIEGGTINLDIQGTSIGAGLILQNTGAGNATMGQLRINLTTIALTKEIVSIAAAGGTIRDVVVDLQASDWLPDAARNAIELVQTGSGTMNGFGFPTISAFAGVVGNAQRPLTKTGTVSNAKYGLVNAINFATPTPNF